MYQSTGSGRPILPNLLKFAIAAAVVVPRYLHFDANIISSSVPEQFAKHKTEQHIDHNHNRTKRQ